MADYIIQRDNEYLQHFGIKGQKWGVRRYENEDGTLTEAGKKRYLKSKSIQNEEKISGKQMLKNAVKRGSIGAVVGSSVGQLVDRASIKKQFDNATQPDWFEVKTTDDLKGYTLSDYKKYFTREGKPLWKDKKFIPSAYHELQPFVESKVYNNDVLEVFNGHITGLSTKFKNRGEALHFSERMTKNLLSAPATGALIGAGAGALGSFAVDKLHNAKIDRAKKFVETYEKSYQKTVAMERALEKQVEAYKDAHPNSMLKDKEIAKMLLTSSDQGG